MNVGDYFILFLVSVIRIKETLFIECLHKTQKLDILYIDINIISLFTK